MVTSRSQCQKKKKKIEVTYHYSEQYRYFSQRHCSTEIDVVDYAKQRQRFMYLSRNLTAPIFYMKLPHLMQEYEHLRLALAYV